MTDEWRKKMHELLYTFAQTHEELGGLATSYGWNSVNAKCERAEKAIWEHLNNIPKAQ